MSSWNSVIDGWIHERNGWDSKNGSAMVNPGSPIHNWLPKSANILVNCFKSLGTMEGHIQYRWDRSFLCMNFILYLSLVLKFSQTVWFLTPAFQMPSIMAWRGKKFDSLTPLQSMLMAQRNIVPSSLERLNNPTCSREKRAVQLGFLYHNNAKPWMTSDIYQQWLLDWDAELCQLHRNILLLQDNFSSHIPPPNLQNVCIENFKPNLTSHVQCLNQGIIHCFKAHYWATYIHTPWIIMMKALHLLTSMTLTNYRQWGSLT